MSNETLIHFTLLIISFTCLLSIFKAFLPNSKANPNVNIKKKINVRVGVDSATPCIRVNGRRWADDSERLSWRKS